MNERREERVIYLFEVNDDRVGVNYFDVVQVLTVGVNVSLRESLRVRGSISRPLRSFLLRYGLHPLAQIHLVGCV